MDLFARLDGVGDRWNVLRHVFYQRWSEGALRREELAFYAGEYRHAVVALAWQARAAARAARPEVRADLERHAAEEEGHVDLWDDFAHALAAEVDREPLPETVHCHGAWTGGADLLERLAVLYAVESAQPAISQAKLTGLVEHYGMGGDGQATSYFALHAERDHDHAAQSRWLIEELAEDVDADRLVRAAEAALEGNWCLLDGVERRFAGRGGDSKGSGGPVHADLGS
ncbi:MAG: iron-containing redox enzyme family protein [Actinomycetota bacterium]|nr:iron-containing redox enzyme family protein [Actinomycetota bacterium]